MFGHQTFLAKIKRPLGNQTTAQGFKSRSKGQPWKGCAATAQAWKSHADLPARLASTATAPGYVLLTTI